MPRLRRTLAQFRRRSGLRWAGLVGLATAGLGAWLNPIETIEGAVLLALGGSVASSVFIAAITIERADFAQSAVSLGVSDIFHDRHEFSDEFWTELIDSAHYEFRLLGVANHGYLWSPEARDSTATAIMRALRDRRIEVEILWLDPEHQLAFQREHEEGRRGTRMDIVTSILFFWEIRQGLKADERQRFVLKEHQTMPTCGIHWSDNELLITHYLAGQLNRRAPGLMLDRSVPLADRLIDAVAGKRKRIAESYINNFREVSKAAVEITAERIERLQALRLQLAPEATGRRSEADLRQEEEDE